MCSSDLEKNISSRYFLLIASEGDVKLEQADDIADLSTIVALNESLAQSERYLDI